MSDKTGGKLNGMQELFCREYLIDFNGKRAAVRAGYAENSAQEQASRLLSHDKVQARIRELNAPRVAKFEVTAERVLRELHRIATCDLGEAIDDGGRVKPMKDIPEDVRRAMQGLEVEELFEGYGQERHQIGYTKKVKFWDKNKALELIGRHLKMFTDNINLNVNDGLAERMNRARQKAVEGKKDEGIKEDQGEAS